MPKLLREKEVVMEAPAPAVAPRINRWLPYWAVLQTDLRQTLNSWVYRTWVIFSVLAAVGYLLYRVGVYREAGIIQHASATISDLMRWAVLGSIAFVVVLTAGSISSERGTMADSVLSRGISRYQYYLGKWHARLAAILGTYLGMGLLALVGSFIFLHEDLSIVGSLIALATVAAILMAVVTTGVTVSAVFNSTVLSIAILWVGLYGAGFGLSLMPEHYPTPDRALTALPHILRGDYNGAFLGKLAGYSLAGSLGVALMGLGYFSRRDI